MCSQSCLLALAENNGKADKLPFCTADFDPNYFLLLRHSCRRGILRNDTHVLYILVSWLYVVHYVWYRLVWPVKMFGNGAKWNTLYTSLEMFGCLEAQLTTQRIMILIIGVLLGIVLKYDGDTCVFWNGLQIGEIKGGKRWLQVHQMWTITLGYRAIMTHC